MENLCALIGDRDKLPAGTGHAPADDHGLDVPVSHELEDLLDILRTDRKHHSFLRFRDPQFPRGDPLFLGGNLKPGNRATLRIHHAKHMIDSTVFACRIPPLQTDQ